MKQLWLILPSLLTACSFNASGLSVPPDASIDRTVTVVTKDAMSDSDARDPCRPDPCENGGTCAQGDGGSFICRCAEGFDGPSCGKCALGYSEPNCELCPETKLTIQSCTHADIDCKIWIDGDNTTKTTDYCPNDTSGCFATNIDFDLGSRQYVRRIRFLSDWHAKRPSEWDLWASDDNINFSLVMSAYSNDAEWKCIQGEPCTAEVPKECCPNGTTQDTSSVSDKYPKWDDFTFSGVTAQYWRFNIKTTQYSKALIMRELELYGHDCLGELACATSSCAPGVCTGQEKARCTCADCKSMGVCTSAFSAFGKKAPDCTTLPK